MKTLLDWFLTQGDWPRVILVTLFVWGFLSLSMLKYRIVKLEKGPSPIELIGNATGFVMVTHAAIDRLREEAVVSRTVDAFPSTAREYITAFSSDTLTDWIKESIVQNDLIKNVTEDIRLHYEISKAEKARAITISSIKYGLFIPRDYVKLDERTLVLWDRVQQDLLPVYVDISDLDGVPIGLSQQYSDDEYKVLFELYDQLTVLITQYSLKGAFPLITNRLLRQELGITHLDWVTVETLSTLATLYAINSHLSIPSSWVAITPFTSHLYKLMNSINYHQMR